MSSSTRSTRSNPDPNADIHGMSIDELVDEAKALVQRIIHLDQEDADSVRLDALCSAISGVGPQLKSERRALEQKKAVLQKTIDTHVAEAIDDAEESHKKELTDQAAKHGKELNAFIAKFEKLRDEKEYVDNKLRRLEDEQIRSDKLIKDLQDTEDRLRDRLESNNTNAAAEMTEALQSMDAELRAEEKARKESDARCEAAEKELHIVQSQLGCKEARLCRVEEELAAVKVDRDGLERIHAECADAQSHSPLASPTFDNHYKKKPPDRPTSASPSSSHSDVTLRSVTSVDVEQGLTPEELQEFQDYKFTLSAEFESQMAQIRTSKAKEIEEHGAEAAEAWEEADHDWTVRFNMAVERVVDAQKARVAEKARRSTASYEALRDRESKLLQQVRSLTGDRDRLESSLAKHSGLVNNLNLKVFTLQQEQDASKLTATEKSLDETKKLLSEAELREKTLQTELESLRQRCATLEKADHSKDRSDLDQCVIDRRSLTDELRTARDKERKSEEKVILLLSRERELQTRLDILDSKLGDAQIKLANKIDTINDLDKDVDNLQNLLRDKEKQLSDVMKAKDLITKQADVMSVENIRLGQLDDRFHDLQDRLSATEDDRDRIKAEASRLKEQIQSFKGACDRCLVSESEQQLRHSQLAHAEEENRRLSALVEKNGEIQDQSAEVHRLRSLVERQRDHIERSDRLREESRQHSAASHGTLPVSHTPLNYRSQAQSQPLGDIHPPPRALSEMEYPEYVQQNHTRRQQEIRRTRFAQPAQTDLLEFSRDPSRSADPWQANDALATHLDASPVHNRHSRPSPSPAPTLLIPTTAPTPSHPTPTIPFRQVANPVASKAFQPSKFSGKEVQGFGWWWRREMLKYLTQLGYDAGSDDIVGLLTTFLGPDPKSRVELLMKRCDPEEPSIAQVLQDLNSSYKPRDNAVSALNELSKLSQWNPKTTSLVNFRTKVEHLVQEAHQEADPASQERMAVNHLLQSLPNSYRLDLFKVDVKLNTRTMSHVVDRIDDLHKLIGDTNSANRQQNSDTRRDTCQGCGKAGHVLADCRQTNRNNNRGGERAGTNTGYGNNTNRNPNVNRRDRRDDDGANRSSNKEPVCYLCHEPGHKSPDCPGKTGKPLPTQNGQRSGQAGQDTGTSDSNGAKRRDARCDRCGRSGHLASDCRMSQRNDSQSRGRSNDRSAIRTARRGDTSSARSNSRPRNKSRSRIICSFCHGLGHDDNNCDLRPPDQPPDPGQQQGRQSDFLLATGNVKGDLASSRNSADLPGRRRLGDGELHRLRSSRHHTRPPNTEHLSGRVKMISNRIAEQKSEKNLCQPLRQELPHSPHSDSSNATITASTATNPDSPASSEPSSSTDYSRPRAPPFTPLYTTSINDTTVELLYDSGAELSVLGPDVALAVLRGRHRLVVEDVHTIIRPYGGGRCQLKRVIKCVPVKIGHLSTYVDFLMDLSPSSKGEAIIGSTDMFRLGLELKDRSGRSLFEIQATSNLPFQSASQQQFSDLLQDPTPPNSNSTSPSSAKSTPACGKKQVSFQEGQERFQENQSSSSSTPPPSPSSSAKISQAYSPSSFTSTPTATHISQPSFLSTIPPSEKDARIAGQDAAVECAAVGVDEDVVGMQMLGLNEQKSESGESEDESPSLRLCRLKRELIIPGGQQVDLEFPLTSAPSYAPSTAAFFTPDKTMNHNLGLWLPEGLISRIQTGDKEKIILPCFNSSDDVWIPAGTVVGSVEPVEVENPTKACREQWRLAELREKETRSDPKSTSTTSRPTSFASSEGQNERHTEETVDFGPNLIDFAEEGSSTLRDPTHSDATGDFKISRVTDISERKRMIREYFHLQADPDVPLQDREKLCRIMEKWESVFSLEKDEIGEAKGVLVEVPTKEEKPIRMPPRRFAPHIEEAIENEVKWLLKHGRIRRSQSPWAAAVVPVVKADGTVKPAVDYRALNSQLIFHAGNKIIASVHEGLTDLATASPANTGWATFDLVSAYNQLRLSDDAVLKSAFITRSGLYEHVFAPYGIQSLPAILTIYIRSILDRAEEKGYVALPRSKVAAFFDDLTVGFSSIEEGAELLDSLFHALHRHGLQLKLSKACVLRKEIRLLGYKLSRGGISATDDKVKAILALSPPISKTELRSFLGLVQFQSQMIPNLALVAKPLYACTSAKSEWKWTDDCQSAFEKLKQLVGEQRRLVLAGPDDELHCWTDASLLGWGAVLTRKVKDEDGKDRYEAVRYASKAFGPRVRTRTATELEALGVIGALKEFREDILGKRGVKFHVDHASLPQLLRAKAPKTCKLAAWALEMDELGIVLEYTPGTKQFADFLSRHPLPASLEDIENEDRLFLENKVFAVTRSQSRRTAEKRPGGRQDTPNAGRRPAQRGTSLTATDGRRTDRENDTSNAGGRPAQRRVTPTALDERRLDGESDTSNAGGRPAQRGSTLPSTPTSVENAPSLSETSQLLANQGKITPFHSPSSTFHNLFPCKISIEGKSFTCVEQFFQWKKARFAVNNQVAQEILATSCPAKLRKLGNSIQLLNKKGWNRISAGILATAILEKFSQNERLRTELFRTDGTVLANTSPKDFKWGIGATLEITSDHPYHLWKGKNWLGVILTTARETLAKKFQLHFQSVLQQQTALLLSHPIGTLTPLNSQGQEVSSQPLQETQPRLHRRRSQTPPPIDTAANTTDEHDICGIDPDVFKTQTHTDWRESLTDANETLGCGWAELREKQKRDHKCSAMINFIESEGVQIPDDKENQDFVAFHSQRYCVWDGILFFVFAGKRPPGQRRHLLFAPASIRQELLLQGHHSRTGGHFSHERTLQRLLCCVYWESIRSDVLHFTRACAFCNTRSGKHRTMRPPLKTTDIPSLPWEVVTIDILKASGRRTSRENQYIVAMQDVLTKFAAARPMKTQMAHEMCDKILDINLTLGVSPRIYISDRGASMIAEDTQQLARLGGSTWRFSTASSPVGQIERLNREILGYLSKLSTEADWDLLLPWGIYSINSTPSATLGQLSPTRVFLGQSARPPEEAILKGVISPFDERTDWLADHERNFKAAWSFARNAVLKAQGVYKKAHDKNLTHSYTIRAGDWVMWKRMSKRSPTCPKLSRLFTGPWLVISMEVNTAVLEVKDKLERVNVKNLALASPEFVAQGRSYNADGRTPMLTPTLYNQDGSRVHSGLTEKD